MAKINTNINKKHKKFKPKKKLVKDHETFVYSRNYNLKIDEEVYRDAESIWNLVKNSGYFSKTEGLLSSLIILSSLAQKKGLKPEKLSFSPMGNLKKIKCLIKSELAFANGYFQRKYDSSDFYRDVSLALALLKTHPDILT